MPHRATPQEIGQLRREIREELKREKESGIVRANVFMKAGTLDDSSWMWLTERMRPQEIALLEKMCGKRRPFSAG